MITYLTNLRDNPNFAPSLVTNEHKRKKSTKLLSMENISTIDLDHYINTKHTYNKTYTETPLKSGKPTQNHVL